MVPKSTRNRRQVQAYVGVTTTTKGERATGGACYESILRAFCLGRSDERGSSCVYECVACLFPDSVTNQMEGGPWAREERASGTPSACEPGSFISRSPGHEVDRPQLRRTTVTNTANITSIACVHFLSSEKVQAQLAGLGAGVFNLRVWIAAKEGCKTRD